MKLRILFLSETNDVFSLIFATHHFLINAIIFCYKQNKVAFEQNAITTAAIKMACKQINVGAVSLQMALQSLIRERI